MQILFGDYIQQKRFENRLSLRKFCEEMGFDPANWSKIERGLKNAPTDKESIKRICDRLKLNFDFVYDLAKISVGKLPEYNEEDFLKKLPIFFNRRPNKNKLEYLRKLISEEIYGKENKLN